MFGYVKKSKVGEFIGERYDLYKELRKQAMKRIMDIVAKSDLSESQKELISRVQAFELPIGVNEIEMFHGHTDILVEMELYRSWYEKEEAMYKLYWDTEKMS